MPVPEKFLGRLLQIDTSLCNGTSIPNPKNAWTSPHAAAGSSHCTGVKRERSSSSDPHEAGKTTASATTTNDVVSGGELVRVLDEFTEYTLWNHDFCPLPVLADVFPKLVGPLMVDLHTPVDS